MPSLIDVLDSKRIEYRLSDHHHVRDDWVGVDCPKCSAGWGKFRLGLHSRLGSINCWNCGRLKWSDVVPRIFRCSQQEAVEIWKSIDFDRQSTDPIKSESGVYTPPKSLKPLAPLHKNYLRQRGFDLDQLDRIWGINRGIAGAVELSWRVFIPICDELGREVSWTTRSVSKTEKRRYVSAEKTAEAIPHKNLLYGSHLARSVVIVVEGPIDAWAIGPGAVATLGISCTEVQKALISKYPIRYICFDSSPDAQNRAERLCLELAVSPGVTENVVLETGKDPAEINGGERRELRSLVEV